MNKLLKVFLIILLLSAFCCCFSYATEDDENDIDASSSQSADEVNSRISDLASSTVTNVLPVNNYMQANIELNNILCVILIAVGVVIILFAIAILIKLKK